MAKAKTPSTTVKTHSSMMPPDAQIQQLVVPSGAKLLFTDDDQDAILKFIGMKDITDKYAAKYNKPVESLDPILYLTFHDGKKLVSMSMSYTLRDAKFELGYYYYIRLEAKVQTNPNQEFSPMKDFAVAKYTVPEGGFIDMTWRLPLDELGKLKLDRVPLTLESIKILNYEMLNYPLRSV